MWIKDNVYNSEIMRIFITDKEFDKHFSGCEMEAVCVGNWRRIDELEKKLLLEDLNKENK